LKPEGVLEQEHEVLGHVPAYLHVVQAFEERDGGIVPVEPKPAPQQLLPCVGYAACADPRWRYRWSRTGDADPGDWGPPEELVRTGVIPDEFEAGGGVE